MRRPAVSPSLWCALAASILATSAPRAASAAQPSEFSPSPEPAPRSAAPPLPEEPKVPTKPKEPAKPAATSGASPPVADADADAEPPSKAPAAPAAPQEPPTDPVVEAMADVPHFAVGAGGAVAFGSAPAVAASVRASAEVATGRWSLGVEGRYDLPASSETPQGGRARTSLAGGSFVPCFRAKGTWACGVVLASRMTIDGTSANGVSATDASFFLGVGARLEMHLPLPLDFALRIVGEILAHPIPYELVAGGQRVFKSSVISATLGPMLVRAF